MSKTFYITTPLYYVNAPPHLGGTYSTIVADTIARYKRMMGFDVKLFTGTDEHGQKIERSAKAQGTDPKSLADRVYTQYVDLWKRIGIEFDEFVRTTEQRHHISVGELYRRAKAAGYIYKGEYSGWYCVSCEAYAPESDPSTPANCPDCGRKTEWFSEESYFFKLSAFQDRLLELYEKNPTFVRPETRKNEIASLCQGWSEGPVDQPCHVEMGHSSCRMIPRTSSMSGSTRLTGYLSGVSFKSDDAKFDRYWPANLHLVGKDILRFHTVYWPAFLLAAGLEPPSSVFGHGWWLFKEEKMSKSRGNVLDPYVLVDTLRIGIASLLPAAGNGVRSGL